MNPVKALRFLSNLKTKDLIRICAKYYLILYFEHFIESLDLCDCKFRKHSLTIVESKPISTISFL